MKIKSLFAVFAVSLSTLAFAQESPKAGPPAGNAIVGDTYGSVLGVKSESNAISVGKLSKKLKKAKKVENVAIKGTVAEVCEKKRLLAENKNRKQF